MNERTILITGATGQQGGAVARALLAGDWKVRAFVRDDSKPASQELRSLGAELAVGDLNDPASVERALSGVYGVYAVQTPMTPDGTPGEIRQGKALADAAAHAGVKHFVYGSVGAADQNTRIPHFESKRQIEVHIRDLGLPYTFLRPAFYYENFTTFFAPQPEGDGYVLRLPLQEQTTLGMIAVCDIGAFAALAFAAPRDFVGRSVEIGGDSRTMPEVARLMEAQCGKPVRFEELPIEAIRAFSEDLAVMFEWFNRAGQKPDVTALRKLHPGLLDVAAWLRASGWHSPGG
ncbi:MAG: NmrA/HSCARG family protein [Burkholderiales bacterium]